MKKVVRLTESDLVRIVKRVISEQDNEKMDLGLRTFNTVIVPRLINAGFKQKPTNNQVISYGHPKGVTFFYHKNSKEYVVYLGSATKRKSFRMDEDKEAVDYAFSLIK